MNRYYNFNRIEIVPVNKIVTFNQVSCICVFSLFVANSVSDFKISLIVYVPMQWKTELMNKKNKLLRFFSSFSFGINNFRKSCFHVLFCFFIFYLFFPSSTLCSCLFFKFNFSVRNCGNILQCFKDIIRKYHDLTVHYDRCKTIL